MPGPNPPLAEALPPEVGTANPIDEQNPTETTPSSEPVPLAFVPTEQNLYSYDRKELRPGEPVRLIPLRQLQELAEENPRITITRQPVEGDERISFEVGTDKGKFHGRVIRNMVRINEIERWGATTHYSYDSDDRLTSEVTETGGMIAHVWQYDYTQGDEFNRITTQPSA